MRINPSIPQTTPAHIARAYGLSGAESSGPVGRIGRQGRVEAVAEDRDAPSKTPGSGRQLVAGVVPGGVDFSGDAAQPAEARASLAMYRHPADKNAAATGVSVGRTLDVQG